MNEPLISIIIPSYNRAWCIKRAIDSCLRQTYQNFEIIITDDGSTDDTQLIIESYKCNKIKYFKFFKNRGVIKARNNCIINSNGEWIILLDSDDELLPDCLSVFSESIVEGIDIIFAHFLNPHTGGSQMSKSYLSKIEKNNILKFHDLICNNQSIGDPLPFVKRCVFEKIPYDTHVLRNMSVIWHQFFRITDVLVLDIYLAICHISVSDRITMNRVRDANLWVEGVQEYLNLFSDDIRACCPSKLSFHYRSLGIYQFLALDVTNSRKSFIEAIKINPFEIKSLLYLLASFNVNFFNIIISKKFN